MSIKLSTNKVPHIYIALFLFLIISTGTSKAQIRVLYASDYVKAADSDAISGVLQLLKDAREQKATRIVFAKGTYHFYDAHAFSKYSYISNHDSGPRKMALPIIDFHNLEIDGGGSEFIMHGLIIPFAIENSSNITIKNVSVNWYRPTHSELKVAAVSSNKQDPYVDFSISDQYPYEIRNGELIFLKDGFEHNLENAIYWDPETNSVAYQSKQNTPLNKIDRASVKGWPDNERLLYPIDKNDPAYRNRGIEQSLIAHQIKPGLVRITGVKPLLPKVGWILVAKGMNGYNRLAPAFRLYMSDNLNFENVNVHHASGMGLIAENCENVTLNSFNVFPKKGDKRILATTADATHFVGCRGLVTINNCRFENQLDDATNIHGTYVEITGFKNRVADVRIGHFQQIGYDFARPGDTIVAVNPEINAEPLAKFTIKNIEIINPRFYTITFNEDIGSKIKPGYYLENTMAYPEVEIKNSVFINNRARGLLISSPKKVVIEHNKFSNMMSAIQCPNEFTFWYESGFVKDLTIRNNEFLDGSYGNPKPIALINVLAHSENNHYIHGQITIENNTFTNFSSAILYAEFVKNIVFKNNTIRYSGKYPINTNNPVIKLETVGTAEVSDNKYTPEFKNFISVKNTRVTTKRNEAVNANK